jgi:hypothetical protein
MRNWLLFVFVGLGGLAIVACGSDGSDGPRGGGGTGGGVFNCDTLVPPPAGCDDTCPGGSDSECALGTFCLNGGCEAQCTETQGCGGGSVCSVRGRCVMGTGGTGGTGNSGGNACQSVTITPTRSIPNVMFLVDQSGSMDTDDFGPMNLNRWTAAHSAITSIVSDPLDDIVRFGLTTYTSRNGFQAGRTCPLLPTQVGFALDNSPNIGNSSTYPPSYPSGDGEDTPTGDSIDLLVSQMLPDLPDDGPTIIVLATDGLPDSCECADNWPNPIDDAQRYCEGPPTPTDPQIEAVNAAAAAHAAGIDVFVLWVGQLTSTPTRNHLQEVADAGVDGTGTVWVGDDPTSLSNAFQSIVSDSISCDIQMDKHFDDKEQACNDPASDVRLNGVPLSCPTEWRVKPGVDDVIELVGSACDTFKNGDVTFTAEFPCGAIIVE